MDTGSIDESLFIDSYAVLGMERLMHPVDMADWDLKITCERQLFVDDYLLATSKGLTRQLHQPAPYPQNPVMRMREHPWETTDGFSLFVWRDEQTGRFRMWYNTRGFHEAENGIRYRGPTGYATSDDGVNWTKPDLGSVKFGPDRHNNIAIGEGTINGLFYEPNDPDPKRRYKALVWIDPRWQAEYAPREGFYLYWSPDGMHWEGDNRNCVIPSGQSTQFPEVLVGGMGDTSNFVWDKKLNKYICNGKILFRRPTIRTIGHSESDDLVHWTRPIVTMHRDRFDGEDQIGEITRIPYESMWLGLLGVYQWPEGQWKQKYPQLAASRDGRHWYRVNPREAFIPLGSETSSWDPDFTIAGRPGPVLIGDELWFYYLGHTQRDEQPFDQDVGLAKLRRDGFVSLNAGDEAGELITRPMTFSGSRLYVNAQVEKGGYIKVAVCSRSGAQMIPPGRTERASRPASGEPIDGFTFNDAVAVTGDATKIPVRWNGANEFRLSSGDHVRLKFRLKNAKMFSFWIE